MKSTFVLLALAACASCAAAGTFTQKCVFKVANNFSVADCDNKPSGGVLLGYGSYNDTILENGWSFLEVHGVESPNALIGGNAYAVGYLEGAMTQLRIYQTVMNQNNGGHAKISAKVQSFIDQNQAFLVGMIDSPPKGQEAYWYQVALVFKQLQGMYDGYSSVAPADQALTFNDVLAINMNGDLGDIEGAVGGDGPDMQPDVDMNGGRCSGLVRLLDDFSDIFLAHTTWSSLNSMLRVYKLYDLPWPMYQGSSDRIPGSKITFSSYPGSIFSMDDFYVLGQGLALFETTIGYSNPDLKQFITPQTVMEWMRNVVANRLATSGPTWASIFELYNSGTYNNEFLVVDYNLFTPGKTPPTGTLTVLDQVPGHVEWGDGTALLVGQGYWPSYNIPYWPNIFNISGMNGEVDKYGPWFTYNETARANIFRRDAPKIHDLDGMMRMMRYNDFQHDPLSRCNCTPPYTAENAIACRDDLNPVDGVYPIGAFKHRDHVGTDSKITSRALLRHHLGAAIISGPTYDQQPVFKWSTCDYNNTSHMGHPDEFHFPWLLKTWPSA